jgi:hypothetical protein
VTFILMMFSVCKKMITFSVIVVFRAAFLNRRVAIR